MMNVKPVDRGTGARANDLIPSGAERLGQAWLSEDDERRDRCPIPFRRHTEAGCAVAGYAAGQRVRETARLGHVHQSFYPSLLSKGHPSCIR